MQNRDFKEKLDQFRKEHLKKYKAQSDVQKVVEFFFLVKDFRKTLNWKPPFAQNVRVAKQIIEWARGDLIRAYGLIYDCSLYFEEKKLHDWGLNGVYRSIPAYKENRIYHQHENLSEEQQSEIEEARTRKRIAEMS